KRDADRVIATTAHHGPNADVRSHAVTRATPRALPGRRSSNPDAWDTGDIGRRGQRIRSGEDGRSRLSVSHPHRETLARLDSSYLLWPARRTFFWRLWWNECGRRISWRRRNWNRVLIDPRYPGVRVMVS